MDIEYQFFLKEFKGKYGHVLSQIKQSQDVKTSSTIFMQQYEVPAGYKTEAKIMERYNMSKPIYDKLAAGEGKATEGLGTFIAPPPSPSANQPAGGHIVTSQMGMRGLALSPGMHMGVDISGNTGEHLKAFTDGTIEDAGKQSGYGNYVNWIDSSGIAHFYAHMNKSAFVKKGQKVKKGTVLGELGSTGRSSAPHLHWEASTNPKDTGMSKSAVLSRFNPLSKYSKESPFTGSRMTGGSTLSGGIRELHEGEYVINKKSVGLFGGDPFFSMINRVENKKQRSEKSSQLIQHLSKYTGRKIDQRPEMIVAPDPIIIQGPPTYITSGSSRGSSGGGSSNYDQYATLDLRA
jgi:murein DD-endopeptidase MepM/ murein hydrolase activator NlpD